MFDAELALYVVAFAMGMAVVTLSILAYVRFAERAFRQLAAVMCASLFIMLVELLKAYDLVVTTDLSAGLRPFYVAFSCVGFGLIGYSAPGLAFQVVGRNPRTGTYLMSGVLAAVLFAVGMVKELVPGTVTSLVATGSSVVVLAGGLLILGRGLSGTSNARIRSLVRTSLFVMPPLLLVMIVQAVLSLVPGVPALLLEFPFGTLFALFGTEGLLLVYGLRYLFREEPASSCSLSEQFVSRFNISPRECEIVSMMILGYSNRTIGEKLFISAMTVKNHVYHIYRKTSAANKVQLLNLINSLK